MDNLRLGEPSNYYFFLYWTQTFVCISALFFFISKRTRINLSCLAIPVCCWIIIVFIHHNGPNHSLETQKMTLIETWILGYMFYWFPIWCMFHEVCHNVDQDSEEETFSVIVKLTARYSGLLLKCYTKALYTELFDQEIHEEIPLLSFIIN